jgi:Fe-S cluster assembly protein SufB
LTSKTDVITEDYKEKYGFSDPVESYAVQGIKGLSERVVQEIVRLHDEPAWMEQIRMKALKHFLDMKPPSWAPDLADIDFQSFYYYARPTAKAADSWEQLPEYIRRTYDKLGITEAEKKFLAGVGAVYESEAVYHSIQGELEKQGVVFTDTVTALKEYPDIMRKYFGTVVPYQDNYIAALQTAVWSAGSFVYVPEGVKVPMILQAYFRINERKMGQFERTLIVAEPYSEVSYNEGCSAPVYSSQSLHSAIVEIIARKGSLVKYTTLQNWSRDVLNLVTKRAHAYEEATVSWVDFNGGSRLTRKYPSVYLLGPRSKADIISVAYAGPGQVQDTGAKAIHLAKDTTSKIISRSVSKGGGHTAYRGLLHIAKGAKNVKSTVRCVKPDTLILGDNKIISEYQLGNEAMGMSGLNVVSKIYVNDFDGDMVKIAAAGLLPIEVTPEHPMLVSRSHSVYPRVTRNGRPAYTQRIAVGKPQWKPASELLAKHSFKDGDYLLLPRLKGSVSTKTLNLEQFAKNDRGLKVMLRKGHSRFFPLNVDTARVLGLYVAEGYSSQDKVKFALNSEETELSNFISDTFGRLGYSVKVYKSRSENAMEVVVFAGVLSRALTTWCGKGAPNKRIPDFILQHKDMDIVDSFLKGYLLGDGARTLNSTATRNVDHIVTTSKMLAIQIQLLGARKGMFFRITKASKADLVQGRKVKVHEKFDVRATIDGNVHPRIDEHFFYVPVRKIEWVPYRGPVYNLETSDHTYLLSNAVSHNCDALLVDPISTTATYPYMEIQEDDATVTHEASVGKVGEEQLFYLMSRGISEGDALSMVVNGFMEPFAKELPMTYAVEFNRLMSLEMTNAVG